MFSDLANDIGLLGVVAILIAYALLQTQVWHYNQIRYSLLNAIGAGLLLYSLIIHWNLSAAIMEVVWILVSFYGIWKTLCERRKAKQTKAS